MNSDSEDMSIHRTITTQVPSLIRRSSTKVKHFKVTHLVELTNQEEQFSMMVNMAAYAINENPFEGHSKQVQEELKPLFEAFQLMSIVLTWFPQ
jgi:hypothetical protein